MDKHKLGVIVPYRNRSLHLGKFKRTISYYLTKNKIDYNIFVIQQDGAKQFNRGMLLNIGFKYALEHKCDYIVFHDVDMIPSEVDYSYSDKPLHLSTNFKYENNEKERDIFEEYFDCIDSLKLVFYDNTMRHPPGYNEIILSKAKSAYAFVTRTTPENVYVNCSMDDDDALETLIHEIQHLLYEIKPLNPSINISNVFIKPGDKKIGPKDVLGVLKNNSTTDSQYDTNSDNSENIKLNGKILGLPWTDISFWDYNVKVKIRRRIKNNNDPGYICRETEKASNIQSIRNLFGIKPGQNITPEMLKPYINNEKHNTDVTWLLLCWASNGFKDIRLFLSDINKLAFQDTKPTDNTRPV
jgi:hypothetical protein